MSGVLRSHVRPNEKARTHDSQQARQGLRSKRYEAKLQYSRFIKSIVRNSEVKQSANQINERL